MSEPMGARRELAGALRERVGIERWLGAPDGAGGSEGAWTLVAERWAAVEAEGFGPAAEAERPSRAPRFRVTLRTPVDVAMGDRLAWRERAFAVLSVIRDPARPERIEISMEETRA